MITYRSLSDCTWKEAVHIWNLCFEGYIVNVHFDEKRFIARLAKEELSPEYSLVAFYGEQPVGIVLNGFRQIEGKKVAWNGGTGVAKAFRGQGIGKMLIEKCLEIYREQQVDIATLEAIETNQAAIALYQKMGYVIKDTLHFYSLSQTHLNHYAPVDLPYRIQKGLGKEIARLPLWNKWTPWQTQLDSLPEAESVIVWNGQNQPIGYALFKEVTDENGKRVRTILYQCEIAPDVPDKKQLIRYLLSQVFNFHIYSQYPLKPFSCSTFNLTTDADVLEVLQEWGFQREMGQVWMERLL
ncbi:GNAT family N-acetyltransferase [Thermoflavimicrobium dichotomicum]|uniref:Acetyltransferase (GNAT) family protein n=1 Tax=Thermoflavimicrobium dichotomicum TaxID=46223 RepID=A0A1I3L321_9BACL|nr:GNAT family N-acetyltransferase [Thermoflavimicrobium dichotomicum]SFI79117.1 Acetyltransferase (GNAT) family protein [Thermoflavimicrobium dichotomicum]